MADIATPGPPSMTPESQHQRTDSRSVSSTTSSGSRNSRSRGSPAVETAVTRLLVSIKALLEALTLWSELKVSENEVSDVYVRLGNDFNSAVAAFSTFSIDMAELLSVPDDLRGVLEECLSEDANSNNLNKYLPTVRQIITNLLQGLRGKQTLYRQVASQTKHRSSGSSSSTQDRDSRVSRSSHVRVGSARSALPETPPGSETPARRSATGPSSNRTSRRRDLPDQPLPPPPATPVNEPPRFVGGFNPNLGMAMQSSLSQSPFPEPTPAPTNGYPSERLPSPTRTEPSTDPVVSEPVAEETERPSSTQAPPLQRAPPSLKRYSLVDGPLSSSGPPTVIIESPSLVAEIVDDASEPRTATPPPETSGMDAPAIASSLAALKKSDALERRASKRFSTYTFAKMGGGGSLRGPSAAANRKSLAASNVLTAGELAVLAEDEEVEEDVPQRTADVVRTRSRSKSPLPPLPPLPEGVQNAGALSRAGSVTSRKAADASRAATPAPAPDGPVEVFLQIGREVKKVTIEPGCTLATLRMLFLDRFSYNPGKGNFPAIYIRDPASGIQYELEDMDELKQKCLLSLNIEPLDQIKQHIDVQMASLAQEIKDLKTSVTSNSNRRLSYQPSMSEQSFVETTPMAPRPTDRQFSNIARRISHFVRPEDLPPMLPQGTGQSVLAQSTGQSLFPQMTGSSVMSEYTSRIVTDLKTQFDEVQNLRRDLGVMRQLYTEFAKQTKDALGGLRTQTQTVRQLADSQIGGARAYIVSGKTQLDARSQDALTRMEELQDLVETVKDDVLKRQITPKPQVMKTIKDDVAALAAELKALEDHITTVRPMWKKTWEEELQNIVEEQQFLSHQEEFLADLNEDQKAVAEILGHVDKVISIRKTAPGRGRKVGARLPAPGEEGGATRDNVLMEIRNAAIDPQKRLKAIEANQKTRERELASKSDEFERELTGFVDGNKLRKTGGAEEIERVRQVRNDTALKAMFTGGSISDGFSTSDGS